MNPKLQFWTCIVCCGLLLSLASVSAIAQQRGTITGRIVTDDGNTLSGVTVMLMSYSGGITTRSYKTTLTDEEGKFQFTGLPQRTYTINVTESLGYVTAPRPVNAPPQVYRIGDQAVIRLMRGGVITGRVTYPNGEPIIGVYVTAFRVRDAEGIPLKYQTNFRTRLTDDRGVYRIYGLQPGSYIVAANHSGASFYGNQSPFDGDAATYHPASPRDTASELQVAAGTELANIDIRYRSERGHVLSGKVIGGSAPNGSTTYLANIMLLTYPAGMHAGITASRPDDTDNGFAFLGIPDGEYELIADRGSADGEGNLRAESRRVTVRGGDVIGIELKLMPMASITGRVLLEASTTACDPKAKPSVEEFMIVPRREEKATETTAQTFRYQQAFVPDEKGEFKLYGLIAGQYRIASTLPGENWFVKSIASATGPANTTAKSPATTDLGRSGITLKSGEKLSGVTITIADGAVSLRGNLAPAKPGGRLSSRVRVHLIPAELTAVEDALRYGETITTDGSFAFTNFAPGKYWLLAKAVPDNDPADRLPMPLAWNATERSKLRKEAEAAKHEVELKACQRISEYVLKF